MKIAYPVLSRRHITATRMILATMRMNRRQPNAMTIFLLVVFVLVAAKKARLDPTRDKVIY